MELFLIFVIFILQALTLPVPRHDQGQSDMDSSDNESVPRHDQGQSDVDSSDIVSVPRVGINTSPCNLTTAEHDVIVDCANKNLNHLRSDWFSPNTTILNLEGNLLDSIPDGIFENCSQLQTLNLNNNKIETIMARAFLGLHKLENLDLGMNQLDICDKRFSVSTFEQVDNLRVLDLLQNLPFDKDQYCYGFIGNIVSLTSLSIDTRGKHVYFGEEFQNLTKLEKLIITGNAEIITDSTFKYLVNLRYLDLNSMNHINYVSINFLVPLVKLDQLFMSYMDIGTAYTLSLLHPFVGKNMTTIHFKRMCLPSPWLDSDSSIKDCVLDSNKTAILRKICVSNFTFVLSHLFYLDIGALTSDTWNQCLQNLDLSVNPWHGNLFAFYTLLKLKNLRSIVVADNTESHHDSKFPMVNINSNRVSILSKTSGSRYSETRSSQFHSQPLFWKRNYLTNISSLSKGMSFSPNTSQPLKVEKKKTLLADYGNVTFNLDPRNFIWLSETIHFIDFSRLLDIVYMSSHFIFIGAKNVEYIDISDSGFNTFTGKVEGLTGIKTIIASGNDMSVVSPTFFDTFTSLETLAIANCYFDVNFISTQSTRFLSVLKNLKRLDLSSNSLNILAQDIFQTNTNLTELSLSENRFSEIPFSMTNTPKLTRLDIRYNAFTSLQPQITDKLDLLAHKWVKFELFLDGNILSCACQNIKFLQWLRLTAVTLDRDGNFTCINEQGVLTYTDAYIDLEVFWRQCWGQFFFYISLILFSFMTIGFLCAFVINKYRTYIISQLLGIFFGFRQHLPGDYKIGVFFAYEDLDYQFVTGDLKRFVEQRLGMSTYIRHRDLDPGVVLGEAIAEAIASCWRTVIIINQDFQYSSEYFQFTCRSAVSMISLTNPFRVLVLVTEQYRHRIPRDILSAIQEDNIVVVERLEMDGAMQQILRNRLTR